MRYYIIIMLLTNRLHLAPPPHLRWLQKERCLDQYEINSKEKMFVIHRNKCIKSIFQIWSITFPHIFLQFNNGN